MLLGVPRDLLRLATHDSSGRGRFNPHRRITDRHRFRFFATTGRRTLTRSFAAQLRDLHPLSLRSGITTTRHRLAPSLRIFRSGAGPTSASRRLIIRRPTRTRRRGRALAARTVWRRSLRWIFPLGTSRGPTRRLRGAHLALARGIVTGNFEITNHP